VFITDNIGTSREKRALPALWEADAVVDGVVVPGVDMTSRLPVPASWLNSSNISDIAQRMGGEAVKVDDPGRAFRQMIQRMRLRYSLLYEMPPSKAGKRRSITVELSSEASLRYHRARIRARDGYVVPEK
jgi:hypothetical protein